MTRYDQTGITYSQTRRPDSRIAAAVDQALGGVESVANIGAGTDIGQRRLSWRSNPVES